MSSHSSRPSPNRSDPDRMWSTPKMAASFPDHDCGGRTQHMAPTQPNSSPATTYLPHQRLGNPHRSPRRQAIPLPDHPGSNGPGSTATEVITRRHINFATLGGTWTPVRTLAIHAPIPYPSPRRSGNPSHLSNENDSWVFPTTTTSSHQHHPSIQKHHAGKLLARIWMLFLLLISAQSASIHPGVQYTNLQKMTAIWNNSAVPWGPPPQAPPHHYMPQMDWTRHLHWAQQHHQNSQQPDPLDPTLHWAIQQQARIPNINEVRANM